MIIDFTVENFRSIREAVTLSAVAQTRSAGRATHDTRHRYVKPDSEIAPAYPLPARNVELLPVLGIFGANASGKSNVLMALDLLLRIMTYGTADWRALPDRFVPFKLDVATSKAPTRFELRLALQGTIYTYSLWLDRDRILFERLDRALPPPKHNKTLFERRWEESRGVYVWQNGVAFRGPHTRLEASVRQYVPFLSLLAQQLEVGVTEALASWLRTRWRGVSLGDEDHDRKNAARLGHAHPEELRAVSEVIRLFDTGIDGIEIRKTIGQVDREDEHYQVIVWHQTESGRISWPMEEESAGTQRLFGLAYRISCALHGPALVLVDELGSSIHPHISRAIIRLFQDSRTNPKRAQLIFASHDNTLLRGHLLRRDQIWFTQKRVDGSTDLYPLSDFKVRNDLALDKAYLDGRYGAVPILPEEEDLLPAEAVAR